MQEILSSYYEVIDSVLEENPIVRLENLLREHQNITASEIIQLNVKLKKHWNNYAKYELGFCIVLTEEECDGEELIYKYDFAEDIKKIIQNRNGYSKIYYLNSQYQISESKYAEEKLTAEQCSNISQKIKKIILHLGMKGIDIFIDGVTFSADNFINSYKDLMDAGSMLSICDYGKLLKGFYEENVQYDINKRYFVRKGDIPKRHRSETIEKFPKLLRNRPEELFEIDFVKYLKNHCRDTVIKEYTTVTGDRYDVLVRNEEDYRIFIFEIKWLGRSITPEMKVFEEYNDDKRAISGAYQLLDYVTNADTYNKYFLEFQVHCAILLIFDARDTDLDIDYPKEILEIPNIDLNRRFFMEPKKISASNIYASRRKKVK